MNLLTVIAIDRYSSDIMGRTFSTESLEDFKTALKEWEDELPFTRYELVTPELIDDYSDDIKEVLDEFEISNKKYYGH